MSPIRTRVFQIPELLNLTPQQHVFNITELRQLILSHLLEDLRKHRRQIGEAKHRLIMDKVEQDWAKNRAFPYPKLYKKYRYFHHLSRLPGGEKYKEFARRLDEDCFMAPFLGPPSFPVIIIKD